VRERLGEKARSLAGLPRIFQLVWQANPPLCAALALLNLLHGLVPVAQAWLTKLVIDLIGAATAGLPVGPGDVLRLVALGAGIALVASCVEPTSTFVQVQLGDFLKREVQLLILRKTNSLADLTHFEDPAYYDRLQRAQGDAGYRPLSVMFYAVQLFRSVVQLASMLAVLLAFQPLLVVATVLLAVPALVQQLNAQISFWEITSVGVPEVRRMNYYAQQLTRKEPAAEIRIYGLGDFFRRRWEREFDAFHARMRALRRHQAGWEGATAALAELGSSAAYAWLVVQALAGRITLGQLSLYAQAVWQGNTQIRAIVSQLSSMYADVLFVGQLFEFLETPPAMAAPAPGEGRRTPAPLRAGIELRDVTFRYPGTDRDVLRGLRLTVAPGECIALVGENGAGKTTVVKLLTRLYDPTEGAVLVDGVDLREHDLEDWRRQSGAIFQDFSRYHFTARENVGLGDVARLDDLPAIAAAAGRGGAASVIEQLPAGYDTVLSLWLFNANNSKVDEGVELSGGEWQKVALSRGFMRATEPADRGGPAGVARDGAYGGAQLLILDEPTAALDTQSESDVYLRFRELTRGRATLLISHRFSTVRMADRIVVLEDGRIKEQGTHAELIALGGTYADLYEKQASRYR
jgi:ATP-binding cassette subfamily B protein